MRGEGRGKERRRGERREWGAGARQTPAAASPVSGTQTTRPESDQRATRAHATHSGAATTTGRGKPARSAMPCHSIAIPERCEPKMSLRLSRAGVCVCARTRAVRIARSEPGRADPAPRTRTDANTIVADRASGHRPRRDYLAGSYLLWKDVRARAVLLLSGGPTAPHTARSTRETTTDRTHCGAARRTAQHP